MDERITVDAGDFSARGLRVGIVASSFNDFIVERLLAGAVDALLKHGADAGDLHVVRVPGAFELPLAAKKMAASGRYDALVAVGCVIRGATPHFDHVANGVAGGLASVTLEHEIPLGFGVLTVDTIEQAIERAGSKAGNKGCDAALAAIQTASVLRRLEK
jgi:6,7-dimethyl-8-ribityllumazine synthase